MPKISIKPLFKLSKAQWQHVMSRVLEKEGGKLTPRGGEFIMDKFAPPVEKEIGTLRSKVPMFEGATEDEMKTITERLPIGEARAKYLSSPGQYMSPGPVGPSAKVLRQVQPGSSEELASGLAYEKLRESPLIPRELSRGMSVIKRDIPELAGREATSERAQLAAVAEQLWKDAVGGGRSMGGKMFENLRNSSRQRSHIKNAKDYFISSFVRWKQDATGFKRAYPREAKILEQVWGEFEASLPLGQGM